MVGRRCAKLPTMHLQQYINHPQRTIAIIAGTSQGSTGCTPQQSLGITEVVHMRGM